MQVRIPFAAIAFLLASAPASQADGPFAGSPLDIQVQIDNADKYPAYDFYLKYGLGNGNPYASLHLTKLQPDSATKLEGNGTRMTEVYLLVVPKDQPVSNPPSGSADAQRWLVETPAGAIQSVRLPGETAETRLGESANHRVVRYRVQLADGHADVTWVGGEQEPDDALLPAMWTLPIGIGLTIAGVLLVILVRWMRNRSASNAQQCNPASTS